MYLAFFLRLVTVTKGGKEEQRRGVYIEKEKYHIDERGSEGYDLIIKVSQQICQTFKHSPVFRIGGDEFVAILETKDFDEYESLVEQFRQDMKMQRMKEYPELPVSVACGVAVYDADKDRSFTDVFQRADGMMYRNKVVMKKEAKRKEAWQ